MRCLAQKVWTVLGARNDPRAIKVGKIGCRWGSSTMAVSPRGEWVGGESRRSYGDDGSLVDAQRVAFTL